MYCVSRRQWAVVMLVQTQTVVMQICVSNNCQVPPGEPVIWLEDVFSFSVQSRGQQRAPGDKSRFKGKCSSRLAALLPSGLFTLASGLHVLALHVLR